MANDKIATEVQAASHVALLGVGVPEPLAGLLASGLGDLAGIIASSKSPADAITRAKQNALADAEDIVAEEVADAILKGQHK